MTRRPLAVYQAGGNIDSVKKISYNVVYQTKEVERLEGTRIGKELRSLNNVIKRYVKNMTNYQYAKNISGANGWIITYLAENQNREIFQKDLEKQFSVTRSTASKVIKGMEEKDLIIREGVPEDARLKRLRLTEKALEMHNAIHRDLTKMESRLTEGFSPQELETLLDYIQRMKKNLESTHEDDS